MARATWYSEGEKRIVSISDKICHAREKGLKDTIVSKQQLLSDTGRVLRDQDKNQLTESEGRTTLAVAPPRARS